MENIIDGKASASRLRDDIKDKVRVLVKDHGVTPGLAVILVGEDPASQVYVRNKMRQTIEAGMKSFECRFPADIGQAQLLEKIEEFNNDPQVHGILVQLPLPDGIDSGRVLALIDPQKDVDGFHAVNVGLLSQGKKGGFVPCTPYGCTMLLKDYYGQDLSGKDAVIIGRSNIVGKPMFHLLLEENCTVTVAHSKTRDLPALCRRADIIVAAVGRAEFVRGDWVKDGAVVIDVGINRITKDNGKTRLVGDVAFDEVSKKAAAITPVPGGVGPMTIAVLLYNTLLSAYRACGLPIKQL
jgi:methylenetetrahydrofolate dehydrogenase (NADP+)/methenyltetrahydrofolate cyclohydrolase